ncbi:MAG: hypothetical protein A3J69_02485 [Candidatus Levybacteria bacterium RIFCSPHIGHO2_02_FULL_42_12]|nr:MAG: hypothetical protein A3J69_02485 [Candidatus Levybacteria bacterium RIFCSPHIGHO2_02_FULL_42_12]OGH42811.1 MAG: hypothetical protein A3B53_01720 [Candidatus Levybacteria bacterium RIFCSPLOWO2_01_FULL_42_15]
MRRYRFLNKDDIYSALNGLRDAFLAAKDGNEVEEIINGLLTYDEKLKIGRRILVAQYLKNGISFDEIIKMLKVGKNTIASVMKNLDEYPTSFELIDKRGQKVQEEYRKRRYNLVGGPKLMFKKKEYTGFKRKDVAR